MVHFLHHINRYHFYTKQWFFHHNSISRYSVFFMAEYRKNILQAAVAVIIGIIINSLPLRLAHHEPLFQEKAGIPLQQISAVIANDGNITTEQANFINHLMPLNDIKKLYNPASVDPIKWNHELFDSQYLNAHKKEFLITWAQLLPANFSTYVKAYLQQTFWFWAPLQKGTTQCFYSIETYADNLWLIDFVKESGIHDQPLFSQNINQLFKKYYRLSSYFFREGVLFWFMLASALLLTLKQKNKSTILLYLPAILLWLTLMISTPVNSSLRYVLVFAYSLPFYIGFLLMHD